MSEVQVETPAAAPAAPPASPPAEVVVTDSQKPPAESATATLPEGAQPDKTTEDPQEKRNGSRRFERRISQAIRRAAEARAEADVLRRQLEELKAPKEPVDTGAPRIQDFDDAEKYAEARARHESKKAVEKLESDRKAKTQREQQQKLVQSWEEKAERAATKYEDFEDVVGEISPTNPMSMAVMHAENGEEVAYHLGKNIKEAERIASLPPFAQVLEIGRLSARLAAEPPKPKSPSKAPAPISPVTGTKAADAAEIKDGMSYADFVKVRNRQLGRNT